ncbi:MAG: hypothetical protein J6X78_07760 [Treponema sp.]|nr:hypothetical protein [Treponema sp.]
MKQKIESSSQTAFSYKAGSSIIHRCSAWIKILLLPIVSVVFFKAPDFVSAVILTVVFAVELMLKFSLKEIFSDLKLVFYYALILLFVRAIVFVTGNREEGFSLAAFFLEQEETLFMLLRLLCMLQLTALIFRTSSSLQLREGFEKIELAVRKLFHRKKATPIANALALFTSFIPLVAKNWNQVKRAWYTRGGKNSIKMYVVLLPVFFSVGMKQAYLTARALSIRAA